jgi:hypothetical protein
VSWPRVMSRRRCKRRLRDYQCDARRNELLHTGNLTRRPPVASEHELKPTRECPDATANTSCHYHGCCPGPVRANLFPLLPPQPVPAAASRWPHLALFVAPRPPGSSFARSQRQQGRSASAHGAEPDFCGIRCRRRAELDPRRLQTPRVSRCCALAPRPVLAPAPPPGGRSRRAIAR